MKEFLLSGGDYTGLIVAAVIILLILIVVVMFVSYYNKFVKMRTDVEEGFSTMDVYLKKRYDIIPNLVNVVKGYAKHEKETLTNVIAARNMAVAATTTDEKVRSENMLAGTLKSLFAVSEQYPNLKADKQFLDLQQQLTALEADIANSRKFYNARVKTYNNAVQVFPGVLFAKMYGHKKAEMFSVDEETERKNVKVEF